MNETARKFGHPDTLLHELRHWAVLLRPAQVTLGSLVLVCKEPAARFSEIGAAASTELVTAVSHVERVLADAFAFDKINYLMLMMVDPDVHFHVVPRYASERSFAGASHADPFWPGPPDVTRALDLDDGVRDELIGELRVQYRPGSSGVEQSEDGNAIELNPYMHPRGLRRITRIRIEVR